MIHSDSVAAADAEIRRLAVEAQHNSSTYPRTHGDLMCERGVAPYSRWWSPLPWTIHVWRPAPLRWRFAAVIDGRCRVCSFAELQVLRDHIEEEGLPTGPLFDVPGYLPPTD